MLFNICLSCGWILKLSVETGLTLSELISTGIHREQSFDGCGCTPLIIARVC